jgi:hypothetical protein
MELTNQRQKTHGSYAATSALAVKLVLALDLHPAMRRARHRAMKPEQVHALDMICVKLARIASGDPNHIDHWQDIAGYASLVVEHLKGPPVGRRGASAQEMAECVCCTLPQVCVIEGCRARG